MGALREKNAEQLILLIFPSESFLRKIQEQVGAELLHLCIYVLAYRLWCKRIFEQKQSGELKLI